MTPQQAQARTTVLMVARLVHHRGLTVGEALNAVGQRRRGEPGPHTDLVAAEADAYRRETIAPLTAMIEAFQPLIRAVTKALAELARAIAPLAQQLAEHAAKPAPGARRDRPAWASTYGPPPRRGRRTLPRITP